MAVAVSEAVARLEGVVAPSVVVVTRSGAYGSGIECEMHKTLRHSAGSIWLWSVLALPGTKT